MGTGVTPTPITATADELAEMLRYKSGAVIRMLYRNGSFPAPIDPELSPRLWRWSVRVVAEYVEGGAA